MTRISPFVFQNLTKTLGWVGGFTQLGKVSQKNVFFHLPLDVKANVTIFSELISPKMTEEKKHDHGPNMAALQTYQTSFASGDLEKIMGVLVGTYN